MSKPKIAVIIGSTRPTRQGDKPAKRLIEQSNDLVKRNILAKAEGGGAQHRYVLTLPTEG